MTPSSEPHLVSTAIAMVTLRLENTDDAKTELNELLGDVWNQGDRALAELALVLVNLTSWLIANPPQHQHDPQTILQEMALRIANDSAG